MHSAVRNTLCPHILLCNIYVLTSVARHSRCSSAAVNFLSSRSCYITGIKKTIYYKLCTCYTGLGMARIHISRMWHCLLLYDWPMPNAERTPAIKQPKKHTKGHASQSSGTNSHSATKCMQHVVRAPYVSSTHTTHTHECVYALHDVAAR